METRRKYSSEINIPNTVALIAVLGSFGAWMLSREARTTTLEQNQKYLAAVDETTNKKIEENSILAQRDRNEMRDDLKDVKEDMKEIKAVMYKIADRQPKPANKLR